MTSFKKILAVIFSLILLAVLFVMWVNYQAAKVPPATAPSDYNQNSVTTYPAPSVPDCAPDQEIYDSYKKLCDCRGHVDLSDPVPICRDLK